MTLLVLPQVSAASQNASLKLHSAHSSFQKERCHQLAVEVAAYLPHVKRVVTAMKQVCPPISAHSPLREMLTEKAEGLLRTYNSLKRLGAEMAAAGKRREQREYQELREIEVREREEAVKRREERTAARLDCSRAVEDTLTSESEEETTPAAEFEEETAIVAEFTNDNDNPTPAEDIHEDSPPQGSSILEKADVVETFVDREDAPVVTPPGPDERVLPLGDLLSDVQPSVPSSSESGNIAECAEKDEVVLTKENGCLAESTEVESFQKVESESPSLAARSSSQDDSHTAALPLVASPDEKLLSILAQVEAGWVTNCQSILRDLKKERKVLEASCDADDIGRKVFGLLQRLQVGGAVVCLLC